MRQGELLGLKWEDVNLQVGVLRVTRTVRVGKATPPKSAKGYSSIRLTIMTKEALQKHKEKNDRGEWVFSISNGTPVSCHNLINHSW